MIQLAYFFLLRPEEYTGTKSPTTSFQINNMSLSYGASNFNTLQTPAAYLKTDTYGKLEFTTQNTPYEGRGWYTEPLATPYSTQRLCWLAKFCTSENRSSPPL